MTTAQDLARTHYDAARVLVLRLLGQMEPAKQFTIVDLDECHMLLESIQVELDIASAYAEHNQTEIHE